MTNAPDLLTVVRSVLCPGLSPEEARLLVAATTPLRATKGSVVLREGEPGKGLLILVRGTVEVLKAAAGGASRVISTVRAPSVLGEIAFVTDLPHTATVRAQDECEIHLLTKAQFQQLVETESIAAHKLVVAIAQVLARRFHRMDQTLAEVAAQLSEAAGDRVSKLERWMLGMWITAG